MRVFNLSQRCGLGTQIHMKPRQCLNFCFGGGVLWKKAQKWFTVTAYREDRRGLFDFENAQFLLEYDALYVNGYSGGWLSLKLCAECTL